MNSPLSRHHVWVTIFAGLGILLSGYLSYRYYFTPGCSTGLLARIVSCSGSSKPVLLIGQPTCIYGFGMFLIVFVLNMITWYRAQPKPWWTALIVVGVIGTLFSGGLTIYELYILNIQFNTLPACVYGLVFYVGILVSSILASKKIRPPLAIPPVMGSL